MIPLAALKAVPWKLVGWGLAAVAVLALGWRCSVWRHSHTVALPAAQEALQREITCGEGSECLKRSQAAQAKAEAASAVVLKGYQDEIESLRNRPVRTRTVRLCPDAASGDLRDAAAPGGTDGTTPGTGVVLGQAGPDIGGRLYALAAEADEVTARCRALQGWNRALAGK